MLYGVALLFAALAVLTGGGGVTGYVLLGVLVGGLLTAAAVRSPTQVVRPLVIGAVAALLGAPIIGAIAPGGAIVGLLVVAVAEVGIVVAARRGAARLGAQLQADGQDQQG
ncbi:MAG: hypothetical protein ACR2NB_00790, partial [Solirubrobacteraceae bacterium]